MEIQSVGELVRKAENDFINGTTEQSKYVSHSLHNTLERIIAYINSVHISGEKDSLGRLKPFPNIVNAIVNIWYRATDIDRSHIKVRATKSTDWINSLFGTVHLRVWMNKARFGVFLNTWGRTLAKFGSAVVKFVEQDGILKIIVVPWSHIICDAVDFASNPVIETLELTEAQLRERVITHGYDEQAVNGLIEAKTTRKTTDKKNKDTKSDYYKLYEVHGNLPLKLLEEDAPDNVFTQQMHVIAFEGIKKGRMTEWQDFTLVNGREKESPYMKTDLIEEDDRTLAIGAVEHLFQAQWMVNHTTKAIKDYLDISFKQVFQTSDPNFMGMNVLDAIANGQVLTHAPNEPLTALANNTHNTVDASNYLQYWKSLGNEIVGVSEAMLGAQPKSGTAWRQTEALLNENYSLFELMTENKGLALEEMFRTRIIPFIKKGFDTTDEVTTTLLQHEIDRIDPMYIKSVSVEDVNKFLKEMLIEGEVPTEEGKQLKLAKSQEDIKEVLMQLGSQRFFKPSQFSDKTWKEQFKDMEWELEVDITGEAHNTQEALTTLSTALKVMMTPGFNENPKAVATVRNIFEQTGAMSPLQYDAIPQPQPQLQTSAPDVKALQTLKGNNKKA